MSPVNPKDSRATAIASRRHRADIAGSCFALFFLVALGLDIADWAFGFDLAAVDGVLADGFSVVLLAGLTLSGLAWLLFRSGQLHAEPGGLVGWTQPWIKPLAGIALVGIVYWAGLTLFS